MIITNAYKKFGPMLVLGTAMICGLASIDTIASNVEQTREDVVRSAVPINLI